MKIPHSIKQYGRRPSLSGLSSSEFAGYRRFVRQYLETEAANTTIAVLRQKLTAALYPPSAARTYGVPVPRVYRSSRRSRVEANAVKSRLAVRSAGRDFERPRASQAATRMLGNGRGPVMHRDASFGVIRKKTPRMNDVRPLFTAFGDGGRDTSKRLPGTGLDPIRFFRLSDSSRKSDYSQREFIAAVRSAIVTEMLDLMETSR
jgi:hypothetical protein